MNHVCSVLTFWPQCYWRDCNKPQTKFQPHVLKQQRVQETLWIVAENRFKTIRTPVSLRCSLSTTHTHTHAGAVWVQEHGSLVVLNQVSMIILFVSSCYRISKQLKGSVGLDFIHHIEVIFSQLCFLWCVSSSLITAPQRVRTLQLFRYNLDSPSRRRGSASGNPVQWDGEMLIIISPTSERPSSSTSYLQSR